MGSLIISTMRGVEIRLDPETICLIFDIALIGLIVYESKMWPTMSGFEPREAIQTIYGLPNAHGMGKPSADSLTVISRVLHHMLCFIFQPQGRHQDEVSYYEAFLTNSIMNGRWIHLGYLMMMHMIACCESTTRVLSYGRFISRVFKDVGVDLSREMDFEAPSTYDTYDDQSMGWMKYEKAPNDSWIRKVERAQPQGHGKTHPGVENEAQIREVEGGVDPQSGHQQRGLELDISPHQTEIPSQTRGVQFESTFFELMMIELAFTK